MKSKRRLIHYSLASLPLTDDVHAFGKPLKYHCENCGENFDDVTEVVETRYYDRSSPDEYEWECPFCLFSECVRENKNNEPMTFTVKKRWRINYGNPKLSI